MKKAEIEVGKEYAVASPNRSGYALPVASRAKVIAVGIKGRGDIWRETSRNENYVLVEDVSDGERSKTFDGEFQREIEHPSIGYPMEITGHLNERAKGYWGKLLYGSTCEGAASSMLEGEFPKRIYAVPLGWVLRPWAEFEAESREIFKHRRKSKKLEKERKEKREALKDRLKLLGFTYVYESAGHFQIGEREAEALADLLEREKLVVEPERLELKAQEAD